MEPARGRNFLAIWRIFSKTAIPIPACALKRPPAPARLPPRRGDTRARASHRPTSRATRRRSSCSASPTRRWCARVHSPRSHRAHPDASPLPRVVRPSVASHRLSPPRTPTPPFAPSPQVGLPDDEIHRRIRVHRGVYGVHGDVNPDEHTLFHLCPARWFHGQLPIGSGRHGFLTEDFHILGAIETFPNPEDLLAHANAQLWEQPGYFYVIQIDPTRLPDVEGFEAADEGRGGKVLVRGAVDAEAVRRVFVAEREADDSMRGKFTNVSPP